MVGGVSPGMNDVVSSADVDTWLSALLTAPSTLPLPVNAGGRTRPFSSPPSFPHHHHPGRLWPEDSFVSFSTSSWMPRSSQADPQQLFAPPSHYPSAAEPGYRPPSPTGTRSSPWHHHEADPPGKQAPPPPADRDNEATVMMHCATKRRGRSRMVAAWIRWRDRLFAVASRRRRAAAFVASRGVITNATEDAPAAAGTWPRHREYPGQPAVAHPSLDRSDVFLYHLSSTGRRDAIMRRNRRDALPAPWCPETAAVHSTATHYGTHEEAEATTTLSDAASRLDVAQLMHWMDASAANILGRFDHRMASGGGRPMATNGGPVDETPRRIVGAAPGGPGAASLPAGRSPPPSQPQQSTYGGMATAPTRRDGGMSPRPIHGPNAPRIDGGSVKGDASPLAGENAAAVQSAKPLIAAASPPTPSLYHLDWLSRVPAARQSTLHRSRSCEACDVKSAATRYPVVPPSGTRHRSSRYRSGSGPSYQSLQTHPEQPASDEHHHLRPPHQRSFAHRRAFEKARVLPPHRVAGGRRDGTVVSADGKAGDDPSYLPHSNASSAARPPTHVAPDAAVRKIGAAPTAASTATPAVRHQNRAVKKMIKQLLWRDLPTLDDARHPQHALLEQHDPAVLPRRELLLLGAALLQYCADRHP